MLRGMVFIDHMNFDIALQRLYQMQNMQSPRLDYNKLVREVSRTIPNVDFVKAYLFVPKPDEFLKNDTKIMNYYKWASGMRNAPFIDVIEGRYVSRPVEGKSRDISDSSTYYKVEKGTDVNFAIHALSKAFFNSYDVGFFMSADTDYINVYEMLKRIGKIVVQVSVKGQQSNNMKEHVDKQVILDDMLFQRCLREQCSMGAN